MPDISNPFFKLLLPVLLIAVVYFIATKRLKYSLQDDLLIVTPKFNNLLSWIIVYLIFMLGTDMIFHWRGAWNLQPWKEQPVLTSIEKVLAVGILGPVAEEMIFRGILLARLNRLNLNRYISLLIITIVWTLIHIDYTIGIKVLIFFNGILLGLSLYNSRSLVVPVILHIIWNLYSVW
ncbi:MAG: CPBP family intramembrane metalloprotease [Ferruginibacter sp.]